jgi:hypothetical protein
MKNLFLKSALLLLTIPFFTMALEPTNPVGFCDRFLKEKDIQVCQQKTQKDDVDWYAATVCNLQKDDSNFWSCWDHIKGVHFNPQALELCGEDKDLNDKDRLTCLDGAQVQRAPASIKNKSAEFQPLTK